MLFKHINKLKAYKKDVKRVVIAGIKLIRYVFKKAPVPTIVIIGTTIVLSATPFLSAWINSKLIDELVKAIDPNNTFNKQLLINLIVATVFVSIATTLSSTLENLAEVNMWFKVGRDLTMDVTTKFSDLDIEHYENPKLQDKINAVKENYGSRPQQFMSQIFFSFSSLIDIVAASTILITFFPLIILIIMITSFPSLIINMIYGRRNYGIWDLKGDNRRDYYWTKDYLSREEPLMELRIFRSRGFLLDRLKKMFDSFQDEQIKVENKRSKVTMVFDTLRIIGNAITGVIIIFMVVARSITLGQFTFYRTTIGRLERSFGDLLRRISRLYEYGLYVADIFDFFELENNIKSGDIKIATKTPPVIKFENVWFKYPRTNKYIFKNFNFELNPKDHVAIVGENGAGKTTLIKILMRFYDIQKGRILINGVELKELDLNSWYALVGTLFQDFNFYHFDAKTNIGVGDIDRLNDMEKIVEASQYADADSFIRKYKYKYNQVLSRSFKNGIDPSSGQKQKIALARAFFKDAPVLILDEPTSSIDPKAEFEIFEKLFSFAKNKTVIIISHRFSTVRTANRILVLDDGQIIEEGGHEDLMKIEGGKYKHAFELQKKGYE